MYFYRPSAITPSATATLNKESQSFSEEVPEAVPQQFKRVREDNESTCARTDLVYIHPPPELRRAIADPQKVYIYIISCTFNHNYKTEI